MVMVNDLPRPERPMNLKKSCDVINNVFPCTERYKTVSIYLFLAWSKKQSIAEIFC